MLNTLQQSCCFLWNTSLKVRVRVLFVCLRVRVYINYNKKCNNDNNNKTTVYDDIMK